MKERIDWEAYKKDLEAAVKNEELWMHGTSDKCKVEMMEENISRLKEELECVENGDYEAVLRRYDEVVFVPFLM